MRVRVVVKHLFLENFRGLANIALSLEDCLYINIDALRDWGHAKDYVYAMDDVAKNHHMILLLQPESNIQLENLLIGQQSA